jgi:DNA-binding HxlR family transcriptional regulator
VELVGKRWTGAILVVLLDGAAGNGRGGLRFSEIAQAVPQLSDRLLSQRMKELEARGLVARTVFDGPPVRVEYALTPMGRELEPALGELKRWAKHWLRDDPAHAAVRDTAALRDTAAAAGAPREGAAAPARR